MLLISYWLLDSNYVHWDDTELLWVNRTIKRHVFLQNDKPKGEDIFLINVSYDNKLIDKLDNEGFPLGNQDITDREKLAHFFKKINANPTHKYILCDIRFELESPDDSLLKSHIEKTLRYVNSAHYRDSITVKPIFNVKYGLSDYDGDGDFAKYRMIRHDSIITTPLLLFKNVYDVPIRRKFGLVRVGENYYLNNFFLDFRVSDFDVKENRDVIKESVFNVKYAHLGELLKVDDLLEGNYLPEEVKDRIVILGDFEDRDIHPTIAGDMPGPLILLNVFLALKNQDNQITVGLVLTLLLCFFGISLLIFFREVFDFEDYYSHKFPKLKKLKSVLEYLSYFVILFLVSVFISVIFDIQLTIILLSVYVKLMDWVVGKTNLVKT